MIYRNTNHKLYYYSNKEAKYIISAKYAPINFEKHRNVIKSINKNWNDMNYTSTSSYYIYRYDLSLKPFLLKNT